VFRLHALSAEPDLDGGAHGRRVSRALDGIVLETAELVGFYGR
jgi:hypothetical protein